MKRKRKDRCRVFNLLDGEGAPNAATRQALLMWLTEHPCPGAPVVEQMEMGL